MGSPNFRTFKNSEVLFNFAIEINPCDCSQYEDVDCDCYEYACDDVGDAKTIVENAIDKLATQFHCVKMQDGYDNGFQVFAFLDVDPDMIVSDWNKYQQACDRCGYDIYPDQSPLFPVNCKNVTPHTLKIAINREAKEIFKVMYEACKDAGMGVICGSTWTSYVDYDWKNHPKKSFGV